MRKGEKETLCQINLLLSERTKRASRFNIPIHVQTIVNSLFGLKMGKTLPETIVFKARKLPKLEVSCNSIYDIVHMLVYKHVCLE